MNRSDYYLIIGWLLMTPAVWLFVAGGLTAANGGKGDGYDVLAGVLLGILPWWAIYFWIA